MDITLPRSEDSERAVLGSIFLDGNVINEAIETIIPEYFYSEKNQTIFNAILALAKDRKPIDLIVLTEALHGKVEPSYLTGITSEVPTSANFKHYADILKSYSVRRKIIAESQKNIEKAVSGEDDYSALLGEIATKFSKLAQAEIKNDIITPKELAIEGNADFANRLDNGIGFTGLSSGFTDLDKYCGGFGKGNLIIIAGATNIGKSSLLLDIAHRLSLTEGRAGLYFSLEMDKLEIFYRLISKEASVDLSDMKTPKTLKDAERQKVNRAISAFSASKFFLDTTPALSLNTMLAKARKVKAKEGIEFICVDYLQLISFRMRDQARHEILSEITKDLKQLARELDLPVIAGAQLNRLATNEGEPRLSHMGESFAINQHADTVVLISKDRDGAILHVAKARQAGGGKLAVTFDYKTVSFVEADNAIRNDRY